MTLVTYVSHEMIVNLGENKGIIRPMKKLLIVLIAVAVTAGCSWENEETLYPESQICDTLDVSFALDVLPILTLNCFSCHSNANAPEFTSGFALEDHADVSASSSRIVGAINHNDGFLAMPRGGAEKLDTCSINTIEAWVNSGSPDN